MPISVPEEAYVAPETFVMKLWSGSQSQGPLTEGDGN